MIVTLSKGDLTRKVIVAIGDGKVTPGRLVLSEPVASATASATPAASTSAHQPKGGASNNKQPLGAPAVSSGPRVNRVFD